MDERFIYCPRCGSEKYIFDTDYETEEGEEDEDGRGCGRCGWEGDRTELVCKDGDSAP